MNVTDHTHSHEQVRTNNTIIVKWTEPGISLTDSNEVIRTATIENASWAHEDGLIKVGEQSDNPGTFNIRLVIPVTRLIGLELSDG